VTWDLKTQKATAITTRVALHVRFSPDGKRLLYAGPKEGTRSHIFIRDLAAGQEIETNAVWLAPVQVGWSADGKKVVVRGLDVQSAGRHELRRPEWSATF